MKYGIQSKQEDGSILYCSSTRNASFTSELDDIAVFAQKSSAEKAVKELRKTDYEITHGTTLSVVAVSMVVDAEFDVPYPKQQTGYIIRGEKWNHFNQRHYTVFFSGPKKQGGDIRWTEHYSSATVFSDEFSARERIQDSKDIALETLSYREREHHRSHKNWALAWRSEEELRKEEERQIEEAKAAVDWHDTLTIELITR